MFLTSHVLAAIVYPHLYISCEAKHSEVWLAQIMEAFPVTWQADWPVVSGQCLKAGKTVFVYKKINQFINNIKK